MSFYCCLWLLNEYYIWAKCSVLLYSVGVVVSCDSLFWPLGYCNGVNQDFHLKLISSIDILSIFAENWCQKTSLMISQYWFWYQFVASRQQAITWTNVDQLLWRNMASIWYNELMWWITKMHGKQCIFQLGSYFLLRNKNSSITVANLPDVVTVTQREQCHVWHFGL